MENFMRARIRERLDATGLSPFEAARRAGAERTFVNDLLIGKKATIRQKAIPALADVLDCDPEYLVGAQDAPRRASLPATGVDSRRGKDAPLSPAQTRLAGICEAGAWRDASAPVVPPSLPVPLDPRFPAKDQVAYLVRGAGSEDIGLRDGDVLLVISGAAYRDGDAVICVRRRGSDQEISARRIVGGVPDGFAPSRVSHHTEVAGRIVCVYRVF